MLGMHQSARHPTWPIPAMWGFSLIELMIGMAILAMLLMIGVPAFGTYIQNAKLRSTADNFYAGLQSARAEAVKRNASVEFIMTDDSGESANTQTTSLSTTGKNWIVRVQDPTTLIYTFVEGKPAAEGSGTSGTNTVDITGTVSSISFNGFGATTLGSSATFAFTNPTGGLCKAASGPMRCLSIVVSIGGQARLCDPAVTTTGDTRIC